MSRDREPRILSQDIGDVDLSYLLYEGDGPTLILLHATGFLPCVAPHTGSSPQGGSLHQHLLHRESDPEKVGLNV
jgi:hypothetical protein